MEELGDQCKVVFAGTQLESTGKERWGRARGGRSNPPPSYTHTSFPMQVVSVTNYAKTTLHWFPVILSSLCGQDISSRDFERLLQYMYRGEVSVPQAELVSLIAAARSLGIR
jgi:hypothetical protein